VIPEAATAPPAAAEPLTLVAYPVSADPLPLRTAERPRQWMDDSPERYANRCLPLLIANQMGWDVLSPADVLARWNGGTAKESIEITVEDGPAWFAASHFGSGILTFSFGYLFRTPPGHALYCKGPANAPKDGIAPLEGFIETDWAPYTFTMNWKFTRRDQAVWFRRGEPIATLLPYPRDYLARFDPVIRDLGSDPALERDFNTWRQQRYQFIDALEDPESQARQQKWQRAYMLGRDVQQRDIEGHQTRLQLAEFRHEK